MVYLTPPITTKSNAKPPMNAMKLMANFGKTFFVNICLLPSFFTCSLDGPGRKSGFGILGDTKFVFGASSAA